MTHHPQPKRPGAWKSVAATLVVVLVAGASAAWHLYATPSSTTPTPAPATTLTVNATSVRSAIWPNRVQAGGAIVPSDEVGITAEVGGARIAQVLVDVGDSVEEGQVLARLDDAMLKAEEAELGAELLRASAELRQARATLERSNSLDLGSAISEHEMEQHRAQAETAEAERAKVSARLAQRRLLLQRTVLRAPHAGVVSSRTAMTGSVVDIGQELFRVLRDRRMEWRAELTAAQLAQVAQRQPVKLQLPDGSSADGTVRKVAPTVDTRSRMGVAYAVLRPDSRVRAGMYATGSIDIGAAPALVVPASAVVVRDGRSSVARLTSSGAIRRAVIVPVQVGRRHGAEVEVVSGLAVGDEVVQSGAGLLGDGDLVRLVANSPATLAAVGSHR